MTDPSPNRADNPDAVPEHAVVAALLEATDEGVFAVSHRGICLFANAAAARLLGYPAPGMMAGLSLHDLIHGGQEGDECAACRAICRGDGGDREEFRRRDGAKLTVRFRSHPMGGGKGADAGFLVTFFDVSERNSTERSLMESELRFRRLHENLRDGWVSCDSEGRIRETNKRFLEIVGYDADRIRGMHHLDIVAEHCRHHDETVTLPEVLGQGYSSLYEKEYVRADGSLVPVEVQVYASRDGDGALTGFWSLIRDITVRKKREAEIRKLSLVVEQNSAIVLITNTEGRIEYVNPRFETVTGWSQDEVLGRTPALIKSGKVAPEVYEAMWTALAAGREWSGELLNRRKDGSLYWEHARIYPLRGESGAVTHYVAVKEDITERKAIEDELYRQSRYDRLTGLPNRHRAFELLAEWIDRARLENRRLGVLVVGIAGFSRVNSEIGLGAGDHVLVQAADRLSEAVDGHSAMLARIGGDRFLLAIEGFASSAALEVVARSILVLLRRPFRVGDNREILLSGEIGIAIFPNDADSPESLLRNAEAAVYRARSFGRDTYRFFVNAKSHERSLRVDLLLQGALERGELFLEYQPIIATGSRRCAGAEALIRWQNPELGRVSPAEFVPFFEECELAHVIGEWILKEAVSIAAAWRATAGDMFMTVNVSPRQLRRIDFVETVAAVLRERNLPPGSLKLEITERLFVESCPNVLGVLEALDELGVVLTLDDFGTGYSALGSLHKLPIRCLKIDRSFVEGMGLDHREAAIVQSIGSLCRTLGVRTVAEGVETPSQVDSLSRVGIDYMQGFHFSRPLPAKDLLEGRMAPLARDQERRLSAV